jgi:hypothetical protein
LETSRPSQYKKWISLQPPRIQLYLLVLWLLTEVDQVATQEEIQGIYTHLANTPKCAEILNYDASGFNFYSAQSTLLSQERVRSDPRGNYDFIHPKLKAATREYFDQRTEFIDLTLAIIQTFRHILQPLEQSVAAMLLVSYHDRLDPPLDTLQEICNSRFLKARDTVIRFGVHLLHHANEEVRQLMDYFYSIRYGPDSNCELDNDGNLVVIDDFLAVSSIKEILDRRIRNNELFSELEPIFDRVASGDKNLFDLNPIERYWLVRWLTQINRPVSNDRLLDYLSQMAL